jgi:hypothetical protein
MRPCCVYTCIGDGKRKKRKRKYEGEGSRKKREKERIEWDKSGGRKVEGLKRKKVAREEDEGGKRYAS